MSSLQHAACDRLHYRGGLHPVCMPAVATDSAEIQMVCAFIHGLFFYSRGYICVKVCGAVWVRPTIQPHAVVTLNALFTDRRTEPAEYVLFNTFCGTGAVVFCFYLAPNLAGACA